MREKFKTFILVLLVSISVVFTKQLWIELPTKVFSVFKDTTESFSSSYSLIDMIAPNKYLINFDEQNHTLFYDESKHSLWTSARESLKNILDSRTIELEEISKEGFSKYNRKRSISFSFPEKLNTYILAKALEVEAPNDIIDYIEEVDQIYIYLGSGEPFFVFSNEETSLKIHDKNLRLEMEERVKLLNKKEEFNLFKLQEIRNYDLEDSDYYKIGQLKSYVDRIEEEGRFNYYFSMKETWGVENDIYIPYEMNNILPRVFVENSINILKEDEKVELAENFFEKDIDHIREVVEDNGSNIYIYDKKVLKLNVNGSLEYFNALDNKVRKRNLYESMNTTANFLSRITGVPEGLYLSNIKDIEDGANEGYELVFKYRIRGIPIILGNREAVDFVEVQVFNDHIKSYKQFMRRDMKKAIDLPKEDRQMLSSFDVIDMNYELFVREYMEQAEAGLEIADVKIEEILSIIKDINLAYYDPCFKDSDEELIGIWTIRTEKSLYGFDVYEGRLIY